MKIGVDAGALGTQDDRLKVGVYRVIRNLLRELTSIDTKNQYLLYSFDPIDDGVMQEFGHNVSNVVLWPVRGWFRVRLPLELRLHPVDVFLGTSQALPQTNAKKIGFIYDLGFLYNPDAYGKSLDALTRRTMSTVQYADSLITISQSSKNDIVKEYSVPESKISVSYPGVDHTFAPKGYIYRTKTPYFVYVGSLNKAKDLSRAIRSFGIFLKKVKKSYNFYLIGGNYWPDESIDDTIRSLGLENSVKKLGIVPDSQLPDFYRGATALFITSHREGFCLPAAEAMACGTPVVTVDRGAMAEIIGKGGIVSKSISEEDISDALYQIATSKAVRERCKKNALIKAKVYNWKVFARTVHTVIAQYEH
jgi:glycosyltransferase involved in cell wall biosynthesis